MGAVAAFAAEAMTPEEIAARWPEAVAYARAIRAEFGDGVRMVCAVNPAGEQLGKPPAGTLAGPAYQGALREPDSRPHQETSAAAKGRRTSASQQSLDES